MDYDLSSCIGFVTNTAIKTITENFNKRLEKHGSTRIQWIAMYFLLQSDHPIGQKELAKQMNIKDSSLARLVDRMERDGLLHRIENPTDRRVRYLQLTDAGQEKAEELLPVGIEFSDLLLHGISNEEVQNYQNVLNKMLKNIED